MNFKELELQRSYISYGGSNILNDFINPALKNTRVYKRSVGFFSSSVFNSLLEGVSALARNRGKIQLLASPHLSDEDVKAILEGYQKREEIIANSFFNDFDIELSKLPIEDLEIVSQLIAYDILDIKLVVTNGIGMYHDKLAILEDYVGNKICFVGSPNESLNAYENNYEKIRVFKSWNEIENEYVQDELDEFDKLWNGKNEFNLTLEVKDALKQHVIKVLDIKKTAKVSTGIELRDYQKQAIDAWVANNYHGFYVMATGTGKTWTAIYSAKELVKNHKSTIVICAPYKHLVRQWSEDVIKAFPDAKIVMVSSENSLWNSEIEEEILRKKYSENRQLIIISTISSFNLDRFKNVVKKIPEEKLLIVDEAHRFTERESSLNDEYQYMLGLSATPVSKNNIVKANELMDFFGGKVFDLPIEVALQKGYLVPYNYYPIFVHATPSEEEMFDKYQKMMITCFKDGVLIDKDKLIIAARGKLRTISMVQEKIDKIESIINLVKNKEHFIVYCGDGKVLGDDGEELRHIQFIKNVLSELNIKASQFTATENMIDRMDMVEDFNKGVISSLVAIRCLDEGINIPSIESALILSSNDDYREFVQRRGRILRTYKGKKYANIYDVIVLGSSDITKIELRRYNEYNRLSLNKDENEIKLIELISAYGIRREDIVMDYENSLEVDIDE